ncbi:hypothetical protein [Peterkaempfera sp. SMS 1(5)a]|uniref:hypothetical protein n=1 Tax=Peterkaempfera podocarpi TaxID=3232308 RepID=UPI00366EA987
MAGYTAPIPDADTNGHSFDYVVLSPDHLGWYSYAGHAVHVVPRSDPGAAAVEVTPGAPEWTGGGRSAAFVRLVGECLSVVDGVEEHHRLGHSPGDAVLP